MAKTMKLKNYLDISIRILIIGSIGFFMTFIPENFQDYFGDSFHECTLSYCHHGAFSGSIDGEMQWGARHYWFSWTMFVLLILALIEIVIKIVNYFSKYET